MAQAAKGDVAPGGRADGRRSTGRTSREIARLRSPRASRAPAILAEAAHLDGPAGRSGRAASPRHSDSVTWRGLDERRRAPQKSQAAWRDAELDCGGVYRLGRRAGWSGRRTAVRCDRRRRSAQVLCAYCQEEDSGLLWRSCAEGWARLVTGCSESLWSSEHTPPATTRRRVRGAQFLASGKAKSGSARSNSRRRRRSRAGRCAH